MDKYIVKISELDSDYFETISSINGYFYQDYSNRYFLKIKWETDPPNKVEFNLFVFNIFEKKRRKFLSERGLEKINLSQLYKPEMINENELGLGLRLQSKRDIYKHLFLHFMFANKISVYLQSSLLYKDDPCELKRDIDDPILNVPAEDRINEIQIPHTMKQTHLLPMIVEQATGEGETDEYEETDEEEEIEDDETEDEILEEPEKNNIINVKSKQSGQESKPRVLGKRKNNINEDHVKEKRTNSTQNEESEKPEIKIPLKAVKRKEHPIKTVIKRVRTSDAESEVSNYNNSSISVGDLTEKEWNKVRENLYAMTNLILNNRQDLVKPFITNLKTLVPSFNFNNTQNISNQLIKDAVNSDTCKHTSQSLEYLFNLVISKYNSDIGLNSAPSIITSTVINQFTDIEIADEVDLDATLTNENINVSQKVLGVVDGSMLVNDPVNLLVLDPIIPEKEKVPSLIGSDISMASIPDYTGFITDIPIPEILPLPIYTIDPTIAQQPLPSGSSSTVSMRTLNSLDNNYDQDISLYEEMETSISDETFIELVHTVWQKLKTHGNTLEVSTIVDSLFQQIKNNYSDNMRINITQLATLYPRLIRLEDFHNFAAYLYSFIKNTKADIEYIQNAFHLYKINNTNNDYINTLKEEILIDDSLQISSLNELEDDYANNRFYSLAQRMLVNLNARRQSISSDSSL